MNKDFPNRLKKIIQIKTTLFVGIGNALKSDDAIGIYICQNIMQTNKIKTLIVESGIEKFVGKINSIEHDVLILIDCTDFDEKPGFIDILPIENIQDFTVNTHTISVKRISEFFKQETYLLGIQPKNVKFGEEFSEIVLQAADELIELLN
ncbi:MAG: hydrogenase maturation protease [Candidatus Cloacimonetes bacterium]|jgi:hydrogenase 3 maturation protease|nr:hydrogenase maturation protease [Candidatus Cloacimonadota bacterium]